MSLALEKNPCEWCGELTYYFRDIKPPFNMRAFACKTHRHLLDPEADRKDKAYRAQMTRKKNESRKRMEVHND